MGLPVLLHTNFFPISAPERGLGYTERNQSGMLDLVPRLVIISLT